MLSRRNGMCCDTDRTRLLFGDLLSLRMANVWEERDLYIMMKTQVMREVLHHSRALQNSHISNKGPLDLST